MIAPAMGTLDRHGTIAVLRITGEVDLASSDAIRPAIEDAVKLDCTGIVVDLSRCAYLDSYGVRLLFELRRRVAPDIWISAVVPRGSFIQKVLELVDLPRAVPLHATLDEALAAV